MKLDTGDSESHENFFFLEDQIGLTSQDNKLSCDTSVRAEDRIEAGTAVDSSYLTGLMSWMNGTETNLPEQQTRTKRPIVFRNLSRQLPEAKRPEYYQF